MQQLSITVSKRDDPTFDTTKMDEEQRWRAYMASFTTYEFTQDVDLSAMHTPLLVRNLRSAGINPKSASYPPSPASDVADVNQRTHQRLAAVRADEQLDMRIAVGSYYRVFHKGSQEWWAEDTQITEEGREGVTASAEAKSYRLESMTDNFVINNEGMKNVSKEDVDKKNEVFNEVIEKGLSAAGEDGDAMDVEE